MGGDVRTTSVVFFSAGKFIAFERGELSHSLAGSVVNFGLDVKLRVSLNCYLIGLCRAPMNVVELRLRPAGGQSRV